MILVVLDTCELRILVDDRISKQGYSLDREHVEHFLVQRRNAVVRRLDLLQVRQLLDAAQVGQFVVLQVDGLEHGQLRDVDGQLGEAHAAEVEAPLVASLGMSNF